MEAEYVVLWAFVSLLLLTSHTNGLKCFTCGWKNEGAREKSDLCATEMECGEDAKLCVYRMALPLSRGANATDGAVNATNGAVNATDGAANATDGAANAIATPELHKGCSKQNAFIDSTKVNVCASPDELNATDLLRPPHSRIKKGIETGNVDIRYKEYCVCDKDRCNQNPETASGREAPPPPPPPRSPITTPAGGGAESLVKSAATLILFLWTAFNLNTFLVSSD